MDLVIVIGVVVMMISGVVLVVAAQVMRSSLVARMADTGPVSVKLLDARAVSYNYFTRYVWEVSRVGSLTHEVVRVSRWELSGREAGDQVELYEHPESGHLMHLRKPWGRFLFVRVGGIVLLWIGVFAYSLWRESG